VAVIQYTLWRPSVTPSHEKQQQLQQQLPYIHGRSVPISCSIVKNDPNDPAVSAAGSGVIVVPDFWRGPDFWRRLVSGTIEKSTGASDGDFGVGDFDGTAVAMGRRVGDRTGAAVVGGEVNCSHSELLTVRHFIMIVNSGVHSGSAHSCWHSSMN
jgi:hypothetical protein